jgi:hypothetical protein
MKRTIKNKFLAGDFWGEEKKDEKAALVSCYYSYNLKITNAITAKSIKNWII